MTESPDNTPDGGDDEIDEDADSSPSRSSGSRVPKPFPRKSLEQCYRVIKAIRDSNNGNPWDPEQIATALAIKPKSSNLRTLLASSKDFGLITSKPGESEISLTELGRKAVFPQTSDDEAQAKLEAFNNAVLFKNVANHYGGNNLPERHFLENTLQTKFQLHPEAIDEFVRLFTENCRFAGIGTELPTSPSSSTESGTTPSGLNPVITTVSRDATNTDNPVCFVIMPFTERDDRHEVGFFTEVLKQVFEPALEKAGFICKTALQQGSDVIQATIVNALLDADMVLADLTEHNPNVLFELGMRMHLDKPVALVRAKGTGPIFDVDNMLRVEEYSSNLWPSTVKKDIPAISDHVKATWDSRGNQKTFMQILKESRPLT